MKRINKKPSVIFNPVMLTILSDNQLASEAAGLLAKSTPSEYQAILPKLLEIKRFRGVLNAYVKSADKIAGLPIIASKMTLSKYFGMISSIIIREKDSLKRFAKYRDDFEFSLLIGDYESASKVLDDQESDLGESCWLIRNRILLLSCQEDGEAVQAYCVNLKSKGLQKLFACMVDYFQVLSDSDTSNTVQVLQNLISKHVIEFKEGGQYDVASLFSLIFNPHSLADSEIYDECLPILQLFPFVDQYVWLIDLMQQGSIDNYLNKKEMNFELLRFLKNASKYGIDTSLQRLSEFIESGPKIHQNPQGEILIRCYREGRYDEVISLFFSNLANLKSPCTYINLIAKSYAYLGKEVSDYKECILTDLITKLASVYRLEAHHALIENDLWSRAVRFRSLSLNIALQSAIFHTLPHRDMGNKAIRAHLTTILAFPEVTPIIEHSITSCDFKNSGCFADADNLIEHRKLKQAIINTHTSERSDVPILLQQLRAKIPLRKDYYEFYSDYCVKNSLINELIEFSALSLTEDENIYACIPMEYLVSNIEDRFDSNKHSLVVVYFYTKLIDQRKAYLLNELFEDFLLNLQVSKPSELIKCAAEFDSLDIIFYKDICNVNVMDCLSCFSSVKELRVERVRILESLLEKGVIDDDRRTQEVNDLVGQWIVNSAINEINGAKIAVDDEELKKRLLTETESLLKYYKQAKNDDSRVTVWADDGVSEVRAYLSGDKNSIALRLFNIHMEAFINDPKFGLDKNLSTEIRHGFFSNLMRSRLEDANLLTELDSDGCYKSNLYWRDQNDFIYPEVLDEIDESFRMFSQGFNALITEAEEWMKIQFATSENERIFEYIVSVDDINELKELMELTDNPKEVSSLTMDVLWRITEECLLSMRDKINGEFRDRLDQLFENLISVITVAKRGAALHNLMTALTKTRSDIRDDVTMVAGWFNKSPKNHIGELSLEQCVIISVNVFTEIVSALSGISISLSDGFKENKLNGPSVKSFVLAVFNLLENCYKRSGLGNQVQIKLNGYFTLKGQSVLEIQNSLSPEVSERLTNEHISSLRMRLDQISSQHLMRTEGGTGLGKASAHISSINSKSKITIDKIDSTFIAMVNYEIENSIC